MLKIGGVWQAASLKGRLEQAGWGAAMGFPALVIHDDGEEIQGHVFVSESLAHHWDDLDAFEGDEYQRTLTTVRLQGGEQVEAFVYTLRQ